MRACVVFQLFEGDQDTVTVRLMYAVIAATKPVKETVSEAEKVASDPARCSIVWMGLAVRILVFVRRCLANRPIACLRVLALTELGKILSRNRTGKPQVCCETDLPLAPNDAALRPLILLSRCELLLVVALRLAGGQRF
jgi:hypothetical protein